MAFDVLGPYAHTLCGSVRVCSGGKEKENKGFCEEKKNNRGSKVRSSCIIKKSLIYLF